MIFYNIFKYSQNKYLKKLSFTFTSAFLSQGINFLILPVISRLYSVENFGNFAIFISISSLISSIGTLQFHQAIFSEKNKIEKCHAFYLSVLVSSINSLVFIFIFHIYSNYIPNILNFNIFLLKNFYYIIFYSLISNYITSLNFFLNLNDQINIVALARFLQVVSMNLVLLLFNKYEHLNILVVSNVFSSLIQLFLLGINVFRVIEKFNFLVLKKVFKNNISILVYSFPHSLFDSFKNNFLNLIIFNSYGEKYLGLYSFADRVIRMPVSFITNATSEVFYNYVHFELQNNNNLLFYKRYIRLIKYSSLLFLVAFIIINLKSYQIVKFIFGERWIELHSFIVYLLPLAFMWVFTSPISIVPIIMRLQKYFFLITLFLYLILFIILVICTNSGLIFLSTIKIKILFETIISFIILAWLLNTIIRYKVNN